MPVVSVSSKSWKSLSHAVSKFASRFSASILRSIGSPPRNPYDERNASDFSSSGVAWCVPPSRARRRAMLPSCRFMKGAKSWTKRRARWRMRMLVMRRFSQLSRSGAERSSLTGSAVEVHSRGDGSKRTWWSKTFSLRPRNSAASSGVNASALRMTMTRQPRRSRSSTQMARPESSRCRRSSAMERPLGLEGVLEVGLGVVLLHGVERPGLHCHGSFHLSSDICSNACMISR